MSQRDDLLAKIKLLSESIWDRRASEPQVNEWLENFTHAPFDKKNVELIALHLLSQFMYFGNRQMRELMKVLYRDIYRYPIVEKIRKDNHDTTDATIIETKFKDALDKTLFLGVGNPSESGCHLLYYFRQENGLAKDRFIHTHKIFNRSVSKAGKPTSTTPPLCLRDPTVERYVFIDDFCGSGHQGKEYSAEIVEDIKDLSADCEVSYIVLVATKKGMETLQKETKFDVVRCVFELDESFKCFSNSSRYFSDPPSSSDVDKKDATKLCRHYGKMLVPNAPFGYGNCQLLIGFQHNTPDNTLPIFWYDEQGSKQWAPIFKRYPKIYS